LETLNRLSRIESDGHAVLSIYVDLDTSRFPTPGTRAGEVRALLAEARRQAEADGRPDALADVERVGELLEHEAMLAGGGLAVFSAAEAGVLEVVRLPEPVEPMVALDTRPWLAPLAAALSGGDWVVALVTRRRARVFRGDPHSLLEIASLTDVVHGRHAQGGWSQAGYQRGIEQQVDEHLRRTAELLLRAHQRRPFEHLVLGASDSLWRELLHSLHPELRERLMVTHALAPVVERFEREHERALLAHLDAGISQGGTAVSGLDGVLEALEHDRVSVLMLTESVRLNGFVCPRCGRLTATNGACTHDASPLEPVDAAERAVDAAIRQSAEVDVFHHDAAALDERGSIAALLRY
jgi:peptide subunit release factor 1 (eRF1)